MPYLGKTPSEGVRARYQFTPDAGTTSISGADANGSTLTFTDGTYVDVYLNGVMLKAGVDYVTTTANTIGSLAATVASDVVDIIVYDTFSVFGGTIEGNVKVNNGTFNVTGATDLDSTLNVDGNATLGGTLGVTGVVTANAGVVVDNITIDGTEIDLSSGSLTLDVAGNIILDSANNGETHFYDSGSQYAQISASSGNMLIAPSGADKDILFKGTDDTSVITALTLDMGDLGKALFKSGLSISSNDMPNVAAASIYHDSSNRLRFVGGTAGFLFTDDGNSTTQLYIDASGFFDVTAASNDVARFSGANSAGLTFRNDTSNEFQMHTASSDALIFGTDGENERMRIDSSGNVGIGTNAPSDYNAAAHNLVLYESGGSGMTLASGTSGQGAIYFADGTSGDAEYRGFIIYEHGSDDHMRFATAASESMRIDSSGGVKMKQGIYVGSVTGTTADNEVRAEGNITAYYSDERLKNFTGTIENAIDKVKSLNGYYYSENEKAKEFGYKNQDKKQVGVSAQEVEAVLPEVVSLAPFDIGDDEKSKSGEDYKTVDYARIVPLLIEAIKEQQTQIDELKEKLNG